ncbi:hypothetical protein QBC36DRAFT_336259 [Triangularia setosa]|uniref:Uncharacterized protein n=1 Tax=Triangularia setosa TaxID=2587417 RepID=A0AAN6W0N2_9PEZI|nr:hypothetical protein QBC36DRAFT_336259 [Podospora setosa]
MFLVVPSARDGRRQRRQSVAIVHETKLSTIPSRCISPERLNEFLIRKFPCGNYQVDITQNVYQISAPSSLCESELLRQSART